MQSLREQQHANGSSRLIRICDPLSSPISTRDPFLCLCRQPRTYAKPTAMPPSATQTKLSAASESENVPVSVAAIAKRRQTRPEASLRSDSPSRMHQAFWDRHARGDSRDGDRIGRRYHRRQRERDGQRHCRDHPVYKKPTPTTVRTTRPSASSRTAVRSFSNSSFGMRQPSRNSSGGMKRRKNISGSSSTRRSENKADHPSQDDLD